MINLMAKDLVQRFDIEVFVETGLLVGGTTDIAYGWFNELFPGDLEAGKRKIFELELDHDRIAPVAARYQGKAGVHFVQGSSETELRKMIDSGSMLTTKNSMLYLDAHWNSYCPTIDEVKEILRLKNKPIFMIDDFNIPGIEISWPYQFTQPDGQTYTLNADFIRSIVPKDRAESIYYASNLNEADRGMCIVFVDRTDEEIHHLIHDLPMFGEKL